MSGHPISWHVDRLAGFGATDAPVLLGLSRFRAARDVVEEKARMIVPDDDKPERLRLRIGREMEPLLIQHVAELTRERHLIEPMARIRRSSRQYRAIGAPFVIAHPDGFAGDAMLEIKTDEFGFEPWGDEDGEPARVVPPMYYAQVQHALAATGRARAFLFVMIGYHDRKLYEIARDDGFIADLVELEGAEWENVLEARSRLAADRGAEIDDLLPELDGSAAAKAWIAKRYPDHGELVLPATAEQERLLAELRDTARRAKVSELELEALKNRVKEIVAANAGLSSSIGTVTWKKPKPSIVVGHEQIAKAYRTIIERELQGVLDGDFAVNQLTVALSKDGALRTPVTFEILDTIEELYTAEKENSRRFDMPRAWTKEGAEE